MAVLALLTVATVSAWADESEYFDASGYCDIISYADWSTNSNGGEALYSTSTFAGSGWETYGFTRKGVNDKPVTGYADLAVTATVSSQSAVAPGEIGRVAINVASSGNRNDFDTYAPDIRLLAGADPSSMTPCSRIVRQSPIGRYYIFDIEPSESPVYFQIQFEVPKSRNGWLQLHEILFYRPQPTVDISYNRTTEICTIVSNNGDLHVLATEYDAEGNPVSSGAGVAQLQHAEGGDHWLNKVSEPLHAEEGDLWLNKVADEGEPYTIEAPATPGHYLDLRVKTVKAGEHSPETRYLLTREGLHTGIKTLPQDPMTPPQDPTTADPNAAERWYDLNGRPIPAPLSGLNIRLRNNRATLLLR